jgi:sugar lactone lactonase YvrE
MAAIASVLLACSIASQAWSKTLWIAYDDGESHIDSYSAKQLTHSGTPTPRILSTVSGSDTSGIAFDNHKNLWAIVDGDTVVEYSAKQVKNLKNDPAPTPVKVFTSAATFSSLYGCNFDKQGNLWLVDYNNDALYEFSKPQLAGPSGDIAPAVTITSPDMSGPNFVTFDKNGNAWVDNESGASIAEFSASQLGAGGNLSATVLIQDDGNGSLYAPGEIGFDSKGNLWVPNYDNDTVVEYKRSQLGSSGAPTPAVTLSSAVFNGPWGLVFQGSGKLVVMNYDDALISKFTANQLKNSGAPVPPVQVQGSGVYNYQIVFGPSF